MGKIYKRADAGGKSGKWHAEYRDGNGKRCRRCTGTTDKQAARQILNHWETEAAKRASGAIDARAERLTGQARRPLSEHVSEFVGKMTAAGRTEKHIDRVRGHIEGIAAFCRFESLADITAESVEAYAAYQRRTHNRAARTVQAHLTSIKGFTKWAKVTGRMASNPLDVVDRPNPQADRRLERRALTVDEWQALRAATLAGPVRMGMQPAERALLYEVALQTGLRANEIRQLTRGRLQLHASPPFVTVASRSTKNSKTARQYITADLAGRLGEHVARKTPAAPVFDLTENRRTAEMAREDLAAARRAWIEAAGGNNAERERREASDFLAATSHDGERFDFHALRHTCGAWLAMAGTHPKAIQTIMRHSSITLTMDTYGHLFPAMEAAAIADLGMMMGGTDPHDLARAKARDKASGRAGQGRAV